jgi:phosphoribosylformylglycinamidine cyclo-ligase
MAVIRRRSWDIPPVFPLLRCLGNISGEEMFRVFNMGIGMALIVPEKEVNGIMEELKQLEETAFVIGYIEKRNAGDPPVVFRELAPA